MLFCEKIMLFFRALMKNLTLGILIAIIFLLIQGVPFLYWVIPIYQEKKLKNKNLLDKVAVNLIAILAIAAVSLEFTLSYIMIILAMELLYHILNIKRIKLFTIDKIFIMSLIIGGLMSFLVNRNIELIMEASAKDELIKMFNISMYDFELILKILKENYIYISMALMSINSFILYYIIEKYSFFKWRVSYLWLIPYIVFFVLERFVLIDNFIIKNLLEISKIVYIIYFIKILSKRISKKTQTLSVIMGSIIAMTFPWLAFAIGGLASGLKKTEK